MINKIDFQNDDIFSIDENLEKMNLLNSNIDYLIERIKQVEYELEMEEDADLEQEVEDYRMELEETLT